MHPAHAQKAPILKTFVGKFKLINNGDVGVAPGPFAKEMI